MHRFIAGLIAVSVVVSASALAEDAAPVRNIAVRSYDLNLNREADARIMLQRIADAADHACGGRPFTQNMHPAAAQLVADYRACRDRAMANAVAALRAPLLNRLYAADGRTEHQLAER